SPSVAGSTGAPSRERFCCYAARVRVVVWQASAFPGCERAALNATRGGWELAGTVVAAIGGQPVEMQYTIACDSRWRTRSAEVNVRDALGMRALCWSLDEAGLWWCGGKEISGVRGCVD